MQGYLIHPAIASANDHILHVADIGTGTGIWLLDLAEELPKSVQLDGFDLNLSQCPPKQWLPENVTMHNLNIHDDIPDEFKGKYGVYR